MTSDDPNNGCEGDYVPRDFSPAAAILENEGRFPFSQNFRDFGSAVNGTRFVGSSHWKIPRKSGKSKKVVPFSRLDFRTECRFPFTFLVVCTSSRSTVGHRHVPGFTNRNSTFATTEISGFFSKMESAREDPGEDRSSSRLGYPFY